MEYLTEEFPGKGDKAMDAKIDEIVKQVIKEGDLVTTLGSVNGKKSGYGDKKKECRPSGWYSSYVLLREDMKILQMNDLDQDSRMLYRQASEAAASVDRICKLYKPETYAKIAVAGCRTAGLLTIAALKCAGFSDIIAIDEDEEPPCSRRSDGGQA